MTRDPDDFAMRGEPDPGAVLVTHLLLLVLGGAMGLVAGITFAVWWLR